MARQTVPHSSNFAFPVTLEPLTIDGHDSGFFGTVRRDEGFPRVLGVAGERYGLLQNGDFINQIEEGFKKADLRSPMPFGVRLVCHSFKGTSPT